MTAPQQPGESDASVIMRRVTAELDERGDTELNFPLVRFGMAFIMMIGAHTDDGWCWCQPKMVPCISGNSHEHADHRERMD